MKRKTLLNPKKKYLQIALNSTLEEAHQIIQLLPLSDRIIIEVGTPLIKKSGEHGIRQIKKWYEQHLMGSTEITTWENLEDFKNIAPLFLSSLFLKMPIKKQEKPSLNQQPILPYIVADLKTMDRGGTEVELAAQAGASAATALGIAPIETLDCFIEQCEKNGLDSMIDMMNVEFPLSILRSLKKMPQVVILHRGVDEEKFNRQKQIPLHEIRRIKGNFDVLISVAGGDTLREVQRSIFNDADIVVVWKSVYQKTSETVSLVENFLKEIK